MLWRGDKNFNWYFPAKIGQLWNYAVKSIYGTPFAIRYNCYAYGLGISEGQF